MPFAAFLKSLVPFKALDKAPELSPTLAPRGGFAAFLKRLLPWKQTAPSGGGQEPPNQPTTGAAEGDEWALSGTWLTMASSNVDSIRYLWDSQILEVIFKGVSPQGDGYDYQYFGISPEVATAFSKASSPGRFVWNHLRGQYPYVRLRGISRGTSRAPTVVRHRPDLAGQNLPFASKPAWMK